MPEESNTTANNTTNVVKENDDPHFRFERYKYNVEIIKWLIGSVALVIIAQVIDAGFKDRSAGLQEIQQYDKYVTEIIVLNKEIGPRRLLAQYFSNVTASSKLRERWRDYYNEVDEEYRAILRKDSITKDKIIAVKKKDSSEWKYEDKIKLDNWRQEEIEYERQLNSEIILPSETATGEWVILAGGEVNLEAAKRSTSKAKGHNLNAVVYKKQSMYRTVIGPYRTKNDAQSILDFIKETINSGAYIVKLNTWCMNSESNEDFIECR